MKILFAGSQSLSNKLIDDSVDTEFEILFASNLQESMDIALREDTQLCIYEWETYGLKLANDIRQNPIERVSNLPIILLIDSNLKFDFEQIQFYNIELVMRKPFLTSHLLKKIKNLCT